MCYNVPQYIALPEAMEAPVGTLFNISIALVVFMGIASGGMFSLVLMSNRKQQLPFTIALGLVLLTAVLGAIGSVSILNDIAGGLANSIVLLILSITLGYALTTLSVLSDSRRKPNTQIGTAALLVDPADRIDVILLAPGEPPEYNTRHAARRLELADDAVDVPPLLLRPFYMGDIKSKYKAIGPSPYRTLTSNWRIRFNLVSATLTECRWRSTVTSPNWQ